jgi:hypothetical protein
LLSYNNNMLGEQIGEIKGKVMEVRIFGHGKTYN